MIGCVFLGRYEVLGKLGEGGMGQVYLARDQRRDRLVVVKVMHAEVASQPKFREGFKREMQFMARFAHPFVVQLYDASAEDPNGPCIVMEHLDGQPLDEVLFKEKRLDPERVGRWLAQLALALEAANARGIIHRDLKPANLMLLEPGTPNEHIKVMDFGLAKLSAAPHIALEKLAGSDVNIACGTPEYMCPEQYRGDEVDQRGDVYSVGCMLFELLTGRLPFVCSTVLATLEAQANEAPPPFSGLGAGSAQMVEAVVRRALAKFPNERPQTARELARDYEINFGLELLKEAEALAARYPVDASELPAAPLVEEPKPVPDSSTAVYHLEAWMPERIAVVKLRGFVEDNGGAVIESVPGLIRVELGGEKCVYHLPPRTVSESGFFGRLLGSVRKVYTLIDVELHMEKKDAANSNQLSITLLLRPAAADKLEAIRIARSAAWKQVGERIYQDLRSYLMGRAG